MRTGTRARKSAARANAGEAVVAAEVAVRVARNLSPAALRAEYRVRRRRIGDETGASRARNHARYAYRTITVSPMRREERFARSKRATSLSRDCVSREAPDARCRNRLQVDSRSSLYRGIGCADRDAVSTMLDASARIASELAKRRSRTESRAHSDRVHSDYIAVARRHADLSRHG